MSPFRSHGSYLLLSGGSLRTGKEGGGYRDLHPQLLINAAEAALSLFPPTVPAARTWVGP